MEAAPKRPKAVSMVRLKLKPTAEQLSFLNEASRECRRAFNAGAVNWLMRQNGFPESEKQSGPPVARKPRSDRKPPTGPPPTEKKERTKIYHAIHEAAPRLDCQMHSSLAREVASDIGSSTSWRETTSAKSKGEKITNGDSRPPWRSSSTFSVPSSNLSVSFGSITTVSLTIYKDSSPVVIESSNKELPNWQKDLLRGKIPAGTFVEDGDGWMLHLPFSLEYDPPLLDCKAILEPVVGAEGRPFTLSLPKRDRAWGVGDGRYLLAQAARHQRIKKEIGHSYRNGNGSGHGRSKIKQLQMRRDRSFRHKVDQVRAAAIADIVRQCRRDGVGLLVWREPSLVAREKCWFEASGLTWDWDKFGQNLRNACVKAGIKLDWKKQDFKIVEANAKCKKKKP